MAFIRWKKNKCGIVKAYLVHSYRDKKGRPKHKTLAYLGAAGEMAPELLEELKEKHSGLNIEWDKIKPAAAPAKTGSFTDISNISDEELMRSLRKLRHERGMTLIEMKAALNQAGLTTTTSYGYTSDISHPYYGRLELVFAREVWPSGMLDTMKQIAPYIRKVFGAR